MSETRADCETAEVADHEEEENAGQVAEAIQEYPSVSPANSDVELRGGELPADEEPVQQDAVGGTRSRRQTRRPRRLDNYYLED